MTQEQKSQLKHIEYGLLSDMNAISELNDEVNWKPESDQLLKALNKLGETIILIQTLTA